MYIGKIETLIGSCTVTRSDGVPIPATAGDPLFQGDIIETAAGGRVGICFIDGTAFNLSDSARMVLKGFGGDGTSAPFDVTQGTFAFVAGEMAKAGRLCIETPFGRIRPRGNAGGIGMLSLVSLFFTAINDAQAASSNVAFLDDGAITAKDLGQFGIVELIVHPTPTTPEKHIFLDDPGETIVLRRVGSSVSEDHVTNSITRMVQLQAAQQDALHTFSLGLQQGPTNTGASGSSTDPSLLTIPINFTTPPDSGPPPPTFLNLNGGTNGSPNPSPDFITPPPTLPLPPPPPVPPTVTATPVTVNVTNNHATVTFTFSVAPTDFVLADTAATGGTLSDLAIVDATHFTAIFTATPGIQINNASVGVIANSYHDINGNVGLGGSTTFTVDTVPPSVTIGTIASDNTISASEGAGGVIVSGTASDGVGGTGVDGQTVTVQILNGSNTVVDSYTTTVSGGNWSVDITKAQAQALTDGSYTVTANVSDAAGNPAPQASQALTVDQDIGETATLVVADTADHVINNAESTAVSFTVGGLDDTGSGTVTFSDGVNPNVVVSVT
ncbi:MAG TPA: Ig-like domain-containing protein, partial [Pseudolabrys sp.]|nr:Ig-like domain-containing protein [Pseudolabrys sp.]